MTGSLPGAAESELRDLSPTAAAQILGVSRSLVYRLVERGELRAVSRVEPAADPPRERRGTARAKPGSRRGFRLTNSCRTGDARAVASAPTSKRPSREVRLRITRLPDGRYRIRYYLAGHGSPKRQRTFDRRKDAERFAAELVRRKQMGELALFEQQNRTVAELAREWWEK